MHVYIIKVLLYIVKISGISHFTVIAHQWMNFMLPPGNLNFTKFVKVNVQYLQNQYEYDNGYVS